MTAPDLSTLKAGDLVTFRNGGTATIMRVTSLISTPDVIYIRFNDFAGEPGFCMDGSRNSNGRPDLIDIVAITPAKEKIKTKLYAGVFRADDGTIYGGVMTHDEIKNWPNRHIVSCHVLCDLEEGQGLELLERKDE